MNLAIEISNFVSDLMDRASGSVHVASYTHGDTATYVLSDDRTHARLIVHHAEKRLTEESRVNTIAPNLVRMLIEDMEPVKKEKSIEEIMNAKDATMEEYRRLGEWANKQK